MRQIGDTPLANAVRIVLILFVFSLAAYSVYNLYSEVEADRQSIEAERGRGDFADEGALPAAPARYTVRFAQPFRQPGFSCLRQDERVFICTAQDPRAPLQTLIAREDADLCAGLADSYVDMGTPCIELLRNALSENVEILEHFEGPKTYAKKQYRLRRTLAILRDAGEERKLYSLPGGLGILSRRNLDENLFEWSWIALLEERGVVREHYFTIRDMSPAEVTTLAASIQYR